MAKRAPAPHLYSPDSDGADERQPHDRVTREMTFTWQAGSGGWFSRIVFGALGIVLLIAAALVSIVLLLWFLLGIVMIIALIAWRTRAAGRRRWQWVIRGRYPPPRD